MFDILGGLGDIAGYFAGSGDRNDAEDLLRQERQGYEGLDPTIAAQQAGPSAYISADPAARAAQLDVLARLRNQYSQGGLDAIDRARLAEINQATSQTGRTLASAATEDAARRGMLNSGAALSAQLQGGQAAAQTGAMQGTEAARLAEESRRATINSAGNVAGQVRGQDNERAAAEDAIARFNAQQRQGAAQSTFQNRMARQNGITGAIDSQYGAKMGDASRIGRLYGGLGRAVGSVGDYFMKPGGAGAAGGGAGAAGGAADAAGADGFSALMDDPEALAAAGIA